MSNRTAILASAVIAGVASVISITSIQVSPARAADECLTTPKASTPAGGHWYYRLEKGTKRKCWYLGNAGAKISKTTTAATSTSDDPQDVAEPAAEATPAPPAPAPQKPIRKSVANARAELVPSAPDEDPALAESTWPPLNEPTSRATPNNENQTAAAAQPRPSVTDPSSTQSWTMASRWPEPNSTASANERAIVPPQETAQQTPALTADRLVTAAAAATGAATTEAAPTVAAATAPQPQTESETVSIGLLLSVLVGVLALAAIIGPVIFNYAKPRKRRETPATRRPIWDSDAPEQTRPLFAQDEYRRQPVILDEPFEDRQADETPHVANTTADEIEELLARASRRSAA
jgi:hypothetical protein